ncbi:MULTISPECIES: restriction endonuclease subunit S [Lactococcus]|uniref:restriction endonuclease subunit S n=1 Tax=Lactococcus TaxID=1357 RepID=UPI001AE14E32|nr:restriction endonuclease subunit S [Lactococcus lactis]MDM7500906.1 restriction endonuclease subunit S [Lactococcus lactis]QTP13250.1 restriction endonuclease subunit S [Lactococcus lactis subsp. lactis]
MMSKKSPQLRFEGFTDDWEDRKLKDVTERVRSNDGRMDLPTLTMSASSGWLDQKDRFSGDISGKEKKNYTLLKKGELSYNHGNSKLAKYGVVFSLTNYEEALVPRVYHSFKALENTSADFIEYMFSTKLPDRELGKLVSSGARMDGLLNINYDDFMNIHISIPNYEEQILVSAFFRKLDETIALHQRKLDLLKEQKKGFLQKMFPKNGAKVPELRFAGFADDWEERKLSDVANHRGGTAIEKYFDKYGVYKVISIGSYGLNSQYVDQNIRAISNEITDGRVVNSGELTMVLNDKTANGTIIGRTLLVEKDNEYVINQRTEIISPKENFDSNFAYTILNGPFREKVKRIVQGGTQIYVNYPAVSNLNLELPKIEEQQKIGSFFKQLDDTIALHQRKLDLLKEQKKGFLQKMFV